ncbi:hypothetical protein CEXT_122881 [Caerostris extrusa]|uniref:Uncharacterized protein n=1 Tax=Caerostris extrusa TaxID=172846 RepID=A0AAV4QTM9_CAEEX|nr:hypothetical protein CEXT_122881 [Caerostris extrusa]
MSRHAAFEWLITAMHRSKCIIFGIKDSMAQIPCTCCHTAMRQKSFILLKSASQLYSSPSEFCVLAERNIFHEIGLFRQIRWISW